MIARPTRRALLTVAAFVGSTLTALAPAAAAGATPALGQHIAVPSYFPPAYYDSSGVKHESQNWITLANAPSSLGLTVANVASGPGSAVNSDWKTVIDATHAHGTPVLGYVDTGYFGFAANRKTLSGDTSAAAWLTQAEQQVNAWYQFYGSSIDGILFDDGENVCGATTGDNTYVNLYRQLNDYVHTYHAGAHTVLNPGVAVPQCYEDAADTIITFEGSYTDLLNPPAALSPPAWQLNTNPDKIWTIVHDMPDTPSAIAAAMAKTKQINSGYVYLTSETEPNPYGALPSDSSFFPGELSASAGTETSTPVVPPQPYPTAIDSTSVDVGWTSAPANRVDGYDILVNGQKVGSAGNFTPQDTDFHILGLQPATSYQITVRSRDYAGDLSAAGPALSVTTEASYGAPPTAPSALTGTALTANTITLTWGASNDSDDYVAHYEVYQNGTRQLTLDPSARTAKLEFLAAGSNYTFTVIARDSTGTASPASNAVTVTTPNPPPIQSPSAAMSASTLTVQAQYNVTFSDHNVFISDGSDETNGYAFGGIHADYLFQNSSFYRHDDSKGATGFNWIPIAAGSQPFLTSNTNGLWKWQTPTSNLAAGSTSVRIVIDGSGGGSPETTLAPFTVTRQ